ncbi:KilA-N domain-containing protein [Aminivibrio sp.]
MTGKKHKLTVQGSQISVFQKNGQDYISLTDMVRDIENGLALIEKWLRNKNTIEFLGIWEEIYNPGFNSPEFEGIKNQAGLNRFVLSVKQWVEKTGSVGIIAKPGRYGGTYAHKDIAFEFASWISPQFKLYLIKEFQRLKEQELRQLGWDIRRNLTKINYRIHTDAIKAKLIPPELSSQQINFIYASEADLLNMALFGKTAKQWRDENPYQNGNIRDEANVSQLVCLANLETLNAHFIHQGLPQAERLQILNQTAIHQMKLLLADRKVKQLEEEK